MKDMGSPQIGQSGGGPLSSRGRIGSSISSSSIFTPLESMSTPTDGGYVCFAPAFLDGQFEQHFILCFSRAHFQLQGLFGTFPAGHADERQPPVDDRRRHGTHRMAIGKFLTVWGRNIHFSV